MILNLTQISSMATSLVQGRLDIGASEVSFYANLAASEVATRVQHRSLESVQQSSTTSGGNHLALPSDFDYPISLSIQSVGYGAANQQLQARDTPWLESTGTRLGQPSEYYVYGEFIEISPSPDSAYSLTLRYGTKMPIMVASTSTPAIGERYHPAIAYKTAEMIALARNDIENAAVARNIYLTYLDSTPSDLAYRQRSREGMAVSLQKKGR
jgi:hypothetical protein